MQLDNQTEYFCDIYFKKILAETLLKGSERIFVLVSPQISVEYVRHVVLIWVYLFYLLRSGMSDKYNQIEGGFNF